MLILDFGDEVIAIGVDTVHRAEQILRDLGIVARSRLHSVALESSQGARVYIKRLR